MLDHLRREAADDRYLSRGERVARALAMLPIAVGALVWVSIRPHLPSSTAVSAGLLIAWLLLGTALLAAVYVRTRQRARVRRHRARKAVRREARSPSVVSGTPARTAPPTRTGTGHPDPSARRDQP